MRAAPVVQTVAAVAVAVAVAIWTPVAVGSPLRVVAVRPPVVAAAPVRLSPSYSSALSSQFQRVANAWLAQSAKGLCNRPETNGKWGQGKRNTLCHTVAHDGLAGNRGPLAVAASSELF